VSSPYVIVVEFKLVDRAATREFRDLIDDNARQSCALELGCRRFDVLVPSQADDQIFLYEIYDDRAAFEAHICMPHFHSFKLKSAGLIKSKNVRELALICEGSSAIIPAGETQPKY
jgi:autoinducer 2-degrading protein